MRAFLGFVGLAMFLGLSAVWVATFRELEVLSAPPVSLTVGEANARPELEGKWVELRDVRLPCSHDVQHASTSPYRLGFGATEAERVIIRGDVPCSDSPGPLRGMLEVAKPGAIPDLSFPGYDFAQWPSPNQLSFSPTGPEEARQGLWTMPPFACFGLLILAFYWRPKPPPTTTLANLELAPGDVGWSEDERVLPPGPLRFVASSIVDRVLTLLGITNIAWIFFTLAGISYVDATGWAGWAGVFFFGALGALMVAGGARLVGNWRSHAQFDAVRHEGLAKLISEEPMLANGVDVGNRLVRLVHPHDGVEVSRVRTENEPPMLCIDGHLFLAWAGDPKAFIVVAEGFFPFELSPTEQRAALRRLVRLAGSRRSAGEPSRENS
jgi:hypothetical protein